MVLLGMEHRFRILFMTGSTGTYKSDLEREEEQWYRYQKTGSLWEVISI